MQVQKEEGKFVGECLFLVAVLKVVILRVVNIFVLKLSSRNIPP